MPNWPSAKATKPICAPSTITLLYSAAKSAIEEKAQAELDAQRLELTQIRQRVAELVREQQRVAERAQQVAAELENLREQQRQDGEILAAAESIERGTLRPTTSFARKFA